MAGQTRNTFQKTRCALFVKTYVAHSIRNYLIYKYEIDYKHSSPQLNKQFHRRSIPEIARLSKALILDYQLLRQFIVLNKSKKLSPKISNDEKIKTYLSIEIEIIALKIARQDKENIVHEDYESAILSPAIERAAGDSLRNIKNDLVFEKRLEELQKEYQRWYYQVAYKYKLPDSTHLSLHFTID